MTKMKLCGLSRPCDIEAANELKLDYIGFVFASKSKLCLGSMGLSTLPQASVIFSLVP